jgi:type VI secretion system secreted protein VgrG
MATLNQENRQLSISTPLGPTAFVVAGVKGSESVSALCAYRVELIALSTTVVDFDKLLGQKVTVTLALEEENSRHLSGIVSRINQGSTDLGPEDVLVTSYSVDLVPSIWLLTRKRATRVFQHQTVPDILKSVLEGFDVSFRLQGRFEPRNYTTQYR